MEPYARLPLPVPILEDHWMRGPWRGIRSVVRGMDQPSISATAVSFMDPLPRRSPATEFASRMAESRCARRSRLPAVKGCSRLLLVLLLAGIALSSAPRAVAQGVGRLQILASV